MVRNLFNINQLTGAVHAGVACSPSGIMLIEPAERVCGPAGVIAAVGTQEHVTIVCHESLSAPDQEVYDRHERTADDDAEKIKAEPWSDKNQCEQQKRSVLPERL